MADPGVRGGDRRRGSGISDLDGCAAWQRGNVGTGRFQRMQIPVPAEPYSGRGRTTGTMII